MEILYETESLGRESFEMLYREYRQLGAKLYNFRESVIIKDKQA